MHDTKCLILVERVSDTNQLKMPRLRLRCVLSEPSFNDPLLEGEAGMALTGTLLSAFDILSKRVIAAGS